MTSPLTFDPSLNTGYFLCSLHRTQRDATFCSRHDYFVLNRDTNTLTTAREADNTGSKDDYTTDLYEISLFAQELLNQEMAEGKGSPSDVFVCNILSLNSSIQSYNSKIDGKAWIQALHVIFAILTLGIFLLKNHLYINELKIELTNYQTRGDLPLSFYMHIDPYSRETLLESVAGYAKFKAAFGDKTSLLLERFAAIEQDGAQKMFTLESLLSADLDKVNQSIFVKTLQEIAETPVSEIQIDSEWSYLFSLGNEKLTAGPREAGASPRIADLSSLTEEEFLALFLKQFSTDCATLHRERSIWDLFSFDTLKNLCDTDFTKVVQKHSLFSDEIVPDLGRFMELRPEQKELYLTYAPISSQLVKLLFPADEFSYETLNGYKEGAWAALLNQQENFFGTLTKVQLNEVIQRIVANKVKVPLATFLGKKELRDLDAALWKDKDFLRNLLDPSLKSDELYRFLLQVPMDSFTAMSLTIRELDNSDPAKTTFEFHKKAVLTTRQLGANNARDLLREKGLASGLTPLKTGLVTPTSVLRPFGTPAKHKHYAVKFEGDLVPKSAPPLSTVLASDFEESTLEGVPGYAEFKAACGDKAGLVLNRFATLGATREKPWTLEALFNTGEVEESFFAMSEQEIAETSALLPRTEHEWHYFFTLDATKVVAATAREEDSPLRLGDIPTITKEEVSAFMQTLRSAPSKSHDFATLQALSIWNFLPFERLQELSNADFETVLATQSLFSAKDPSDKARFFAMGHEKQELYLMHAKPSPELIELLFPFAEFSYQTLSQYSPAAWTPLLLRPKQHCFTKLNDSELNQVVRAIADTGLNLRIATLLKNGSVAKLNNDLWKNENFLHNFFVMNERDESGLCPEMDAFLQERVFPKITSSQYETMRSFMESSGSPALKEQFAKIPSTREKVEDSKVN